MAEFKFYRDRRMFTWDRETVVVTADTQQEAIDLLKSDDYDDAENVNIESTERLTDFDEVAPQINEEPTIEVYAVNVTELRPFNIENQGDLLWNNTPSFND